MKRVSDVDEGLLATRTLLLHCLSFFFSSLRQFTLPGRDFAMRFYFEFYPHSTGLAHCCVRASQNKS